MTPLARNRVIRVALGVLLGALIGVGARLYMTDDLPTPVPVAIGGPFSLTDHAGQRRTSAEFRGKLMLVTFGYTFCPDVCPLDLQLMTDALATLGPEAEKIQPIFISVDPKRDTPAVIRDYVAHFSPRLIGLTGSEAEIAAAAKAYRAFYRVKGDPASEPNYTVDHSAFIYLMARDGSFLTHFTPDMTPDRVAATLRQHL